VVFFDNTACVRCGTHLAVDPDALQVVAEDPVRRCANHVIARCNWLARPGMALCRSCELTRTRPADGDDAALELFAVAETAKRRLVWNLLTLGLPVGPRDEGTQTGVAFDLLASTAQPVTTGHAGGVITLDLAESDAVHREMVRTKLREPYRTVLGHFRHEIGHCYFPLLVTDSDRAEARALFGDETEDYQQSLDRHYRDGASAGWHDSHVSEYATMHPAEDWAETFAHYLHILAALETAGAYGLRVEGPDLPAVSWFASDPAGLDPTAEEGGIGPVIETWLPLSYALNAVSRSIGDADLYPFVLPPPVLTKLDFVHRVVRRAASPGGPTVR
jgi:hypothetical protein